MTTEKLNRWEGSRFYEAGTKLAFNTPSVAITTAVSLLLLFHIFFSKLYLEYCVLLL